MKATYTGGKTTPSFIGDFLSRDYLLPGGVKVNASDFPFEGSTKVVVSANAAQGAAAVSVNALPGAIAANTYLRTAAGKTIYVTSAAAAGATSLTVEALAAAVSSGDTAMTPGVSGKRPIPAGTRIGRTFTERAAGANFGAAVDADDEIRIVAYDIPDAQENNEAEVLRKKTLIKENLLPGWATETSAIKASVRAYYETTIGGAA